MKKKDKIAKVKKHLAKDEKEYRGMIKDDMKLKKALDKK